MTTKILFTGASGQLGSCIQDCFASGKYNNLTPLYTDRGSFDIENYLQCKRVLADIRPNWLVNLAAFTDVDRAQIDWNKAHSVNTTAVSSLTELTRRLNIRMIQISAADVFAGSKPMPYTEKDQVLPLSNYGETKRRAEEAVIHKTIDSFVIRTTWLYSPYGKNYLKTMLEFFQKKPTAVAVTDQISTPTSAFDLAHAILTIIEKSKDYVGSPQVYHYANRGVASWFDFAMAIKEYTGSKCKLIPMLTEDFPGTAKRPSFSVLSTEKLTGKFGINPPYWRKSLFNVLRAMDCISAC